MAVYREKLDSETALTINIALVKNVKNVPDLRCKVKAGNLSCCLVKPSLIVDPMQVVVAANKAALKDKLSNMVTKSIFAEVLYNLSITRKITDSLNRFGISNTDTTVLLVGLDKAGESNIESLLSSIKGEHIDIERLHEFTDINLVKSAYKIKDEELVVSSLTDSVVSRVAAKDILLIQD